MALKSLGAITPAGSISTVVYPSSKQMHCIDKYGVMPNAWLGGYPDTLKLNGDLNLMFQQKNELAKNCCPSGLDRHLLLKLASQDKDVADLFKPDEVLNMNRIEMEAAWARLERKGLYHYFSTRDLYWGYCFPIEKLIEWPMKQHIEAARGLNLDTFGTETSAKQRLITVHSVLRSFNEDLGKQVAPDQKGIIKDIRIVEAAKDILWGSASVLDNVFKKQLQRMVHNSKTEAECLFAEQKILIGSSTSTMMNNEDESAVEEAYEQFFDLVPFLTFSALMYLFWHSITFFAIVYLSGPFLSLTVDR